MLGTQHSIWYKRFPGDSDPLCLLINEYQARLERPAGGLHMLPSVLAVSPRLSVDPLDSTAFLISLH